MIKPNSWHYVMVHEVLSMKVYTRHYRIKPGDIVVDVGGALGVFSVYAATMGARVYAFEPNAESFRYLIRNSEMNNVRHLVQAYPAAAGGKDGRGTLYLKRENPLGNTMHRTLDSGLISGSAEVRTISLAKFVKENGIRRIDLLKLDCEGGEYDILLDAPTAMMKKIRNIALEYHEFGDYNKEQLVRELQNHGFSCTVKQERDDMGFIYASRDLSEEAR